MALLESTVRLESSARVNQCTPLNENKMQNLNTFGYKFFFVSPGMILGRLSFTLRLMISNIYAFSWSAREPSGGSSDSFKLRRCWNFEWALYSYTVRVIVFGHPCWSFSSRWFSISKTPFYVWSRFWAPDATSHSPKITLRGRHVPLSRFSW